MTDALLLPAPFWLMAAAVIVELLHAYPSDFPHPVRLLGAVLHRLEPLARRSTDQRLSGGVSVAVLLLLTGGVCAALLHAPGLGWLFGLWLAASGLALGELLRTCRAALVVLETAADDPVAMDAARQQVGRLVSRDTSAMEAPELRRALAETLAENFNDAFVAPLFWLWLGGPVGLWLYKAASTADSMWGYTTPQWQALGLVAARLDDVLAWVPARLSALLIWISAGWDIRSRWPGWHTIRMQAGMMESPNAGWPMAAAAWLHHARMGGPTPYFGAVTDKPHLGPWPDAHTVDDNPSPVDDWDTPTLLALIIHLRRAGMVGAGIACVLALLLG